MIRETYRKRGMDKGVVVCIPGLMYNCDLGVINQTAVDIRPRNVSHTHTDTHTPTHTHIVKVQVQRGQGDYCHCNSQALAASLHSAAPHAT